MFSFASKRHTLQAGLRLVQGNRIRPKIRSFTTETPPPARSRNLARRLGYTATALGVIYVVDTKYNASAIVRNLRTLWTCAVIAADYKWNFTPEKTDEIPQLHERVAERVYNLLVSNGGLYIKIGQAIGANAAVLPRPMQIKFASLFDDAPQIPYSDVRDVFVQELGRPPDGPGGVFEIFEEQAVASASIAQVHKAKLWPRIGKDGKPEPEQWVAVKVQKPDVSKQVEFDLAAYRAVMWMYENWAFDLPVYFVVDFIVDHLRQELDFVREVDNARQTAEFIALEPELRDKVYIPKVYPEYSTGKVMVAEWIDGVRLSDKEGIFKLMGQRPPTFKDVNPELDPMSATVLVQSSIPTSRSFQMPKQPLKGGVASIMQTMVELFSAQMFQWGWVHCDPHPGNIIVRPSPKDPRQPQLVLLDHGLYVRVPEDFKRQWVNLWRAMLGGDYSGVEAVTKEWGMGMPDLLASFTLMKPTVLTKGRKKQPKMPRHGEGPDGRPLSQYELSVLMKKKLKEFLVDTDRMPKVLIFLTRNMRMVQGNNQGFGAPVNRIKITGFWASRSQLHNRKLSLPDRVKEAWHHLIFRSVMLSLDLYFWKTRLFGWINSIRQRLHLGGSSSVDSNNFEKELEKTMMGFAKDNLGIDVEGQNIFSG